MPGALAIKNISASPAPNETDGVLQDVHWYGGLIGGAFQGYTLGNILSGQFNAGRAQSHSRSTPAMGTRQL